MPTGRWSARDVALVAVFAGLTAALGLVPAIYLPVSPVPVTAQTLAVLLSGAVLGARRAVAAQVLFMALVAIGLPLLSGGRGGLAVFVGPTVGFFLAFPLVAGVVGWLTYRVGAPYRVWWGAVTLVIGTLLVYVVGVPGLMVVTGLGLPQAVIGGAVPFLIGDAVKCVIAVGVAKGVHAGYPGLLPARGVPAASDGAMRRSTPAASGSGR
ncbi:MAG: biotin transporter BioY [Actinomycetia bacterium]|nr:biotin transporter BioY [Actinomycetes bacterium]